MFLRPAEEKRALALELGITWLLSQFKKKGFKVWQWKFHHYSARHASADKVE